MTPTDRIHVYVGEPIRRLLDVRPDDPASQTINVAVERYQAIVAHSMPTMSEPEWMAVADALNDLALWHGPGWAVWLEVADADRLNGLGVKWGIDAQALARRLHDAPYAQVIAVIDIVERLRADPRAAWSARLRAWGALPEVVPAIGALTDDQIATLTELIRAERREDYDVLCQALGVSNGPELWTATRRRLGVREDRNAT